MPLRALALLAAAHLLVRDGRGASAAAAPLDGGAPAAAAAASLAADGAAALGAAGALGGGALDLGAPDGGAAAAAAADDGATDPSLPVLVLGSGGFLGRRVVAHLRARGRAVVEVPGRAAVDLRDGAALRAFAAARGPFSVAVFLAAEVGGAKFLGAARAQEALARHNAQMAEAVFPWARGARVRLLFASSCLRGADSAYGAAKLLGEAYTAALLPAARGLGLRFWNLYGPERVTERSHVLADWAAQCVRRGAVASASSARERRQFLHVDDAAAAVAAVADEPARWAALAAAAAAAGAGGAGGAADGRMTDVSSGAWLRLADVAAALSDAAVGLGLPPCALTAARADAPPRPETPPRAASPLADDWRAWLRADAYPRDAPPRSAHAEHGAGGVGWVALRDGLRHLLEAAVADAAADAAANATAAAA